MLVYADLLDLFIGWHREKITIIILLHSLDFSFTLGIMSGCKSHWDVFFLLASPSKVPSTRLSWALHICEHARAHMGSAHCKHTQRREERMSSAAVSRLDLHLFFFAQTKNLREAAAHTWIEKKMSSQNQKQRSKQNTVIVNLQAILFVNIFFNCYFRGETKSQTLLDWSLQM